MSITHGQKFTGFALSLPDLMTLIFAMIVAPYDALAASCASDMSADSKAGL